MNDITGFIRAELLSHGADIVGFADLHEVPADARCGLPFGIAIAVKMTPAVVRGISGAPTREYYDEYHSLNDKLDMLVNLGAEALTMHGYQAVAQSRAFVSEKNETDYSSALPHKTVATRAGIGWIGKSALLVTPEYGSAVRLSSILTDAPLQTATPVNTARCGTCMRCTQACPAGAIKGTNWALGVERDSFFDPVKCRKTARERAFASIGIEITQCGKCIEVCPYTQMYTKR